MAPTENHAGRRPRRPRKPLRRGPEHLVPLAALRVERERQGPEPDRAEDPSEDQASVAPHRRPDQAADDPAEHEREPPARPRRACGTGPKFPEYPVDEHVPVATRWWIPTPSRTAENSSNATPAIRTALSSAPKTHSPVGVPGQP